MVDRVAFDARQDARFTTIKRRGGKLPTRESLPHPGGCPALRQQGSSDQQAGRLPGVAQPPSQAPARPQHAPDALGHGSAVTGADKAARPEEVVGHGVGGTFRSAFDDLKQVDDSGDPGGGSHNGKPGNAGRSSKAVTFWLE